VQTFFARAIDYRFALCKQSSHRITQWEAVLATEHDPAKVAETMVLLRGREAASSRCDRYIAGSIRSENPREFWIAVKAAIEQVPA
jgi:hypothetical protein